MASVTERHEETRCLSQGFIAVKRHHDQGNSYKGKHFIWGWLTISEVQSILIIDGRRGSTQADMVLEKELRILHLDPKAGRTLFCRQQAGGSLLHGAESEHRTSKPMPTYCIKDIPPNSATPYAPSMRRQSL